MPWEPWKPTLKQEKFLALPLSIREGFYAGAAGAGKSDVLLHYPITHQWYKDPNFKGLFLRRTMPELREEIIPRSITKLDFRKYGGKFNKSDAVWEFESGALYFFGHIENENDVHKYDSAQWNYVAFDELTSFTEWQYLYLTFERIRRDKNSPHLPAIARAASNPGNIGHAWVRRRFIDPCKTGLKIINGKGGNKRIFIPATLADNPHIDSEYGTSLEALPDAEKSAKKYGNWDAYSGQVFEEFRDHKYPDEPPEAMHVIEPFEIPEYWPRIFIIDWGFRAYTWFGSGAISPNKQLFLYRERAWQKTKIEEWCAYVKEDVDREDPRIIKICKSAGQDRGTEHTIQQQVEQGLGRAVSLTDNKAGSRVAGKMLLHEYLRWRQKYIPIAEQEKYSEERAQWLHRNFGLQSYNQYMQKFIPKEVEILPKLQIFNSCKLLIDAIKSCSYDKTNPEDVAEFDGDDPYDGLRYMIDAADKFFEDSKTEFEKVQAKQALVAQFEQNPDYNILHRRAKLLEQSQHYGTQAVSRYRH